MCAKGPTSGRAGCQVLDGVGFCVDLCTSDADCGAGNVCGSNTCFKGCTTAGSKTQCRPDGQAVCYVFDGLGICLRTCNPADPVGSCGTGAGCLADGRCCGVELAPCCPGNVCSGTNSQGGALTCISGLCR
jgi:hypothetical protein